MSLTKLIMYGMTIVIIIMSALMAFETIDHNAWKSPIRMQLYTPDSPAGKFMRYLKGKPEQKKKYYADE